MDDMFSHGIHAEVYLKVGCDVSLSDQGRSAVLSGRLCQAEVVIEPGCCSLLKPAENTPILRSVWPSNSSRDLDRAEMFVGCRP